jgi:hypothetical protein
MSDVRRDLPSRITARQARRCGKRVTRRSAHDAEAFEQLLTRFHRGFWVEAVQHFFAAHGIHGGEFTHQSVARLPFRVSAPADTNGNQGGNCPNGDVARGHGNN